jgi:hypothetical protein
LAGTSYAAASGTLTFAPGAANATFAVPILNDTAHEGNEFALLSIFAPNGSGALGQQNTAVLQITDNDTAGALRFTARAYTAREPGLWKLRVARTGGTAGNVTVNYAATGGTATNGVDYNLPSGTLTFGAGQASKTFALQAMDDGAVEGNETVVVGLSEPTGGAPLGNPSTALVTILEGNPSVQFSRSTYSVSEATKSVAISVRRTGDMTVPLAVDYSVTGGSAVLGVDYDLPLPPYTLSFAPGVAVRTFSLAILKNSTVGGDKTVDLALSNAVVDGGPGNIIGTPGTATLTIKDLHEAVQFSVATLNVSEASSKAVITVRRTGSLVGAVTVAYSASLGGSNPATPNADYIETSGTLTFGPGAAVRTFPVTILPDTIDEGTETVTLALAAPAGAVLGTQSLATLNLLDNEPVVQFSKAKYSVAEPTPKVVISVRRLGITAGQAQVDYVVTSGSATSSDYTAGSGTLTFGSGVATATFPVYITNDMLDEPSETLNLSLQNPINTKLGTPATAILTIADNDVAGKGQFSAAAYSVAETDSPGTVAITVKRAYGRAEGATIDYDTMDGTAVAGIDYAPASGRLTFGLNETTKTFTVQTLDDVLPGSNKRFVVTLSNPGGGLILGPQTVADVWIVEKR